MSSGRAPRRRSAWRRSRPTWWRCWTRTRTWSTRTRTPRCRRPTGGGQSWTRAAKTWCASGTGGSAGRSPSRAGCRRAWPGRRTPARGVPSDVELCPDAMPHVTTPSGGFAPDGLCKPDPANGKITMITCAVRARGAPVHGARLGAVRQPDREGAQRGGDGPRGREPGAWRQRRLRLRRGQQLRATTGGRPGKRCSRAGRRTEPPRRIELRTTSLRVRCSTD